MTKLSRRYVLVSRLLAASAVVVVVALIFGRAVVPGGKLVVSTDLTAPEPYVSQPKPSGRFVLPDADEVATLARLTGGPVYFDVTPPSAFDRVTVTEHHTANGQRSAAAEIGALSSSFDRRFQVKAARPLGASEVRPQEHVFRFTDYVPNGALRTTNISLRGSHRLLAYAADEDIFFRFTTQDMNRELGADPVIIRVYRGSAATPLIESRLADDGNAAGDQASSELRTIDLAWPRAEEDVYRLEFIASGDIFIRALTTAQTKFVFDGHLYLGDTVGYSATPPAISLVAQGNLYDVVTPHAEATQRLVVGGSGLDIDEPLRRYRFALPDAEGPQRLRSSKGDIEMEVNGVFALSEEAFFNPLPAARLINGGVASAVAAMASFELSELARTNDGAYRFFIDPKSAMTVERIEFVFERPMMRPGNIFETFRRLSSVLTEEVFPGPHDRWYDENL